MSREQKCLECSNLERYIEDWVKHVHFIPLELKEKAIFHNMYCDETTSRLDSLLMCEYSTNDQTHKESE